MRIAVPPFVAASITGTVLFATYTSTLRQLMMRLGHYDAQVIDKDSLLNSATAFDHISYVWLSGSAAGAAVACITTPIECIYVHEAKLRHACGTCYYDWLLATRHLLYNHGIPAFYKGFPRNCVRDVVGFSLYFTTYAAVRRLYSTCELKFVHLFGVRIDSSESFVFHVTLISFDAVCLCFKHCWNYTSWWSRGNGI